MFSALCISCVCVVLGGGGTESVRDVGPHFGESSGRKHCGKGGDDRVVSAILTAGEERSAELLRGKILEEACVGMKTPPYGFPLGRDTGLGYGRW